MFLRIVSNKKTNNDSLKDLSGTSNKMTLISVFILVTVDSSFYMIATMSGTIRIITNIIAVILLAIANKNFIFQKKSFLLAFYCVIFIFISGLLFNNIKQTVIIISCILCGWLCTSLLRKNSFIIVYSKIILFLSVFSLATFVFFYFFRSYMHLLPIADVRGGINYYNALFSILSNNSYVSRNYGLFWEPGAFSVFLNIALYLELFHYKKTSFKNNIILILTILTTLSTLGIGCMLLLLITDLFTIIKIKTKGKYLLLAALLVFAITLFNSDYFMFHIFGKLQINQNGLMSPTTTVRLNSVIYPGVEFLKSPLWGVGYSTFLIIQEEKCFNMATFTIINWLCTYGLLGGAPLCFGCIKFFYNKNASPLKKLSFLLFSILLFSTENFITITFIYILIFYSFEDSSPIKLNPLQGGLS